jgi:hypothetical protein
VRNKRIYLFPTPDKLTTHIDIIRGELNKLKPTVLTKGGQVTLSYKANNVVTSYISQLNSQIS